MEETFDILPCGYVSFRDDGIITNCNVTIASWLGYSKEELVGKPVESILTVATRIFYNTHFFPLLRLQSRATEIFLSLRGKDDENIAVLTNAQRTIVAEEHLSHCVFMRVDERKKYEEELLKARRDAEDALRENKQLAELSKSLEQQALELEKHYQHQILMNENLLQFSKIVSHDLQEPIHKIQVFIDRISKDPETSLSRKSQSFALKIDAAAKKLRLLTTSLQEYVAVDKEPANAEVDLNQILETAKSRAEKSRRYSDFITEAEPLPRIEGYEKQLELLFFHLFDNAIQFRSPDRKLSIKVSHIVLQENIFRRSKDQYKYVDHIRIFFEDNGIGFPEEYRDYVFQLLKRIDTSGTGLGIGLPLVKKIVQNHWGEVRVTSKPLKGTRFEIELPMKLKNPLSS